MKYIFAVILTSILIIGCSGAREITGPSVGPVEVALDNGDNNWNWGFWTVSFSEDHTTVEVLPWRHGEYHFCVTKFMETWPCTSCLSIGKPAIQPDSTVKLNITLKHPFPDSPHYTGFDVRGMAYFPPTKAQSSDGWLNYESRIYDESNLPKPILPPPNIYSLPLIFSRADQGGAELLNADGYSCYLIPGLTYSTIWPIFSYSDPKYNIDPTPEMTTINAYKLFASDIDRRMFLVSDVITREYHLALPPGPFTFGYAVDASWWPPKKNPVTDPATDFPKVANSEDPWQIDYEQLLPIKEENIDKDIFKVTVHHRGTSSAWDSYIWAWGLTDHINTEGSPQFGNSLWNTIDEFTQEGYIPLVYNWWFCYGDSIHPGHHLGLLVVWTAEEGQTTEMDHVYGVKFVDIYIEG